MALLHAAADPPTVLALIRTSRAAPQVYIVEGNSSSWPPLPKTMPSCRGKCIYNFAPFKNRCGWVPCLSNKGGRRRHASWGQHAHIYTALQPAPYRLITPLNCALLTACPMFAHTAISIARTGATTHTSCLSPELPLAGQSPDGSIDLQSGGWIYRSATVSPAAPLLSY